MKRPVAVRVAAALVAVFGAFGCATMLELDGYDGAIDLICQCPGFETVADCSSYANKRLDFASDSERQAWLADYDKKQCGVVCDRAAECYAAVPGCLEKRAGCDCCTWKNDVLSCAGNTCEVCSTCSEQATQQVGGAAKCVTGFALVADLRTCACTSCTNQCPGFCQGTNVLPASGTNMCKTCLETECSVALDACMADKP